MSRNGGTYLAVRSRQWVGGRLALNSAGLMFVAAAAAVGWTVSEASTTSETSLFLASWSYSSVELVYTYPPILLWVGILTTLVSAPIHTPFDAIRTAEGHGRVGVRRTPRPRGRPKLDTPASCAGVGSLIALVGLRCLQSHSGAASASS